MKGTTITAVVAALLTANAEALSLSKRTDGSAPKVLHMPIERRMVASTSTLRKRNTISETLTNFQGQGALYFANVTIGTPPQSFSFHIDTGSSDLWTNVKGSQLCQSDAQTIQQGGIPCSASGTYDNTTSSTAQFVNNDFSISYADGTGASGAYLSDVVRFSQATIQNQEFGVGTVSTSAEGVMGIGYPSLETIVQSDNGKTYNNIPQQMVAEHIINAPAYSLWLDDLQSPTGNILFGGVDKSKFQGTLKVLPIQKVQGEFVEMIVTLNGVKTQSGSSSNSVLSQDIPVLLDSGSTLSFLPTSTAQQIYNTVGATFDPQQSVALCNCDLAKSSQTIDFDFDGQTITVGMNELVLPGGEGTTDGPTGCTFGIMAQDPAQSNNGLATSYTLGDSFIRNAYVVYDMGANQISLAQTVFNAQSSNIQEITSSNGSGDSASGVAADESTSAAASVKPQSTILLLGLLGASTLVLAQVL